MERFYETLNQHTSADLAFGKAGAMLLQPQDQQQPTWHQQLQPPNPSSVLGLAGDMSLFELNLDVLRQQVHALAADRALFQLGQQLCSTTLAPAPAPGDAGLQAPQQLLQKPLHLLPPSVASWHGVDGYSSSSGGGSTGGSSGGWGSTGSSGSSSGGWGSSNGGWGQQAAGAGSGSVQAGGRYSGTLPDEKEELTGHQIAEVQAVLHMAWFPSRPGQQACKHFVKTGHCKFGQTCVFDHPRECAVPLTEDNLPYRPGQLVCAYYCKTRHCKFGPACMNHHPKQPTAPAPTHAAGADQQAPQQLLDRPSTGAQLGVLQQHPAGVLPPATQQQAAADAQKQQQPSGATATAAASDGDSVSISSWRELKCPAEQVLGDDTTVTDSKDTKRQQQQAAAHSDAQGEAAGAVQAAYAAAATAGAPSAAGSSDRGDVAPAAAGAAGSGCVGDVASAAAPVGGKQQRQAGFLPEEPLSEAAREPAFAALQSAVMSLAPAGQTVAQLAAQRQAAGQPLPTFFLGKTGCVLLPSADARRLVQMLCPALGALLALQPSSARPLACLQFAELSTQLQADPAPKWQCGLLQPLHETQLLDRDGLHLALRAVKYAGLKAAVTALSRDTEAARFAGAQAAGQPKGEDCGLLGFFWAALGVLRQEASLGVTARPGSKALVSDVMREYVPSVAHVAHMLVTIHNLLLRHGLAADSAAAQQ